MTLRDDLDAHAKKTFQEVWETRDGQVVPTASDVGLGNDAVLLEGTVLYADLAESSALVSRYKPHFAAEVYKAYLYASARIIRSLGGEITSYDGDRIMAVFIGDGKNSAAAKCGLQINWAVKDILQPAITKQYPSTKFVLRQRVGIDTSGLFVARTGIRGTNDLVWVGNSANRAAKMAALETSYPTYITAEVYNMLNEKSKMAGTPPRDMWTDLGTAALGYQIYGSKFWWPIG